MHVIKKGALAALTAFAAFYTASGAYAGTIVTDGNFNNGLTGWTVFAPLGTPGLNTTPGIGVTVVTTGTGTASTPYGDVVPSYQGSTHAAYFVDDNAVESISQLLTLAPHTEYTLSYGLFSTTSGASNPNPFQLTDVVTDLAVTVVAATASSQLTAGVWAPEAETFVTGAGSTYFLSFLYNSGPTPAKDLLITDIAIPEPASLTVLGLSMLATAVATRRRQRSAPAVG